MKYLKTNFLQHGQHVRYWIQVAVLNHVTWYCVW